MRGNRILREIDIRPDLNSIDADRMLIEQVAKYVSDLWPQMNAAELYITAGREFKTLRGHLSKNSAHDKTRIGWWRAFSKEENKFGCGRVTAETYIQIYDAFGHVSNVLDIWKLPQSLRALHLLARLKLDEKKPITPEQLKTALDNGSLRQQSTESDVRRLAETLSLAPSKKRAKAQPVGALPAKTAAKRVRIKAALKILARLALTVEDLGQ